MNDLDAIKAQIAEALDRNRNHIAERLVRDAMKSHPNDDDITYFAAVIAYESDDYDEAIALVTKVLAASPRDYRARWLLAFVYAEKKQYAEAEEVWLALLFDFPEEPDLYAEYAMLMHQTLHNEKACELARRAIAIDPDHQRGLMALLFAQTIAGDKQSSAETLQHVIADDPDSFAVACVLIDQLVENNRHIEAERLAKETLAAQPDNDTLVEVVQDLRVHNHWSMKPLAPFQRYGWGASIAWWFAVTLLYRLLPDDFAGTSLIVFSLLAFVIYSWTWPPLLQFLVRKGII